MAETQQFGFDFGAQPDAPAAPRQATATAAVAPPVATPVAASPPPAPRELHDFGEKIGGARKDHVIPSATAQKASPTPNPESFATAWPLTKSGEAIDADDPHARAFAWALREQCRGFRRHLGLAGALEATAHLHSFAGNQRLIGTLLHSESAAVVRAERTTPVFEHIDRRFWHAIRDVNVYPERGPNMQSVSLTVAGHRRGFIDANDPKLPDEVAKLASPAGGKTITYSIYSMRGSNAGCWIAPTNLRGAGSGTRLKSFETVAEARAYLHDPAARPELDKLAAAWADQHHVSRADVRGATNAERIGEDYRNGRDVAPERFMQDFGFRGVEFGNWVGQGKEATERQGQLNRTYDALRDLAAVTHMQPRDLSLNGTLALSFGARGHGGRGAPLAHYEPGRNVIALTKINGPGCLAHEWFHALDHYVSATKTDVQWQANSTAFRELHSAIRFSGMGKRSEALDKSNGGKRYWSNREELVARAFEAHVHQTLADAGQSDDFLVNLRAAPDFAQLKADSVYPYPTADEVRALAPKVEAAVAVGREAVLAARPGAEPGATMEPEIAQMDMSMG